MYQWFVRYLSNRQQYTFVNNVKSNIGNINYGVPQGSTLGPLLFLLYVNDLPKEIGNSDIKLFADDTNVFLFAKDLTLLNTNANICI